MADEKISALPSAGALAGTEPLPIVQGGVTKKITVQDVANLKATPDLQQVTTAGSTTSVGITVDNGAGESIDIKHDRININNALGIATITSPTLTTATNFAIPNKSGGTETFAMLSDVTGGGVASVSSGTNINVDNTDPANPIINSLSDRYKTSSLTSNTIGNGSKTFTVDANLSYIPLQEVLIVNSPSNHMHGEVTSYSGTTLIVDVNHHTGSGTFASWVINLDGIPIDAITGSGTANEIAYFTSGQVIGSLATSTYPSLTELALVKGVTGSDIQTQINGKMTNPMTTGGDIIYGGGSGVPTRLANGTAGQILQSNGTTLAPSWVAAPSITNTQTLTCIGLVLTTVTDAVNYHIGTIAAAPSSVDARRAFKPTANCTVTAASFTLEQVNNGSNETVSVYLRNVTDATETLIGTFTSDFGASTTLKTLFSGLSISLVTTKDYTIRITTPTFATNPSSWIPSLTLQMTL
jgi:hypothetical protein